MWYSPPTRRSIEHLVTSSVNGANQLRTCSGFVSTSKTSASGASNSRVLTISSSVGYSWTVEPCRLGVTGHLLSLEFLEVVVHAIQPLVPRLLVFGQPLVERSKARGLQAVEPTTPLRPAGDEPDLAEHPQVLRDLRLGHREVVHDRADRLLASDQRVEDLATVRLGDCVEDIRRRGRAGHGLNIYADIGICQIAF